MCYFFVVVVFKNQYHWKEFSINRNIHQEYIFSSGMCFKRVPSGIIAACTWANLLCHHKQTHIWIIYFKLKQLKLNNSNSVQQNVRWLNVIQFQWYYIWSSLNVRYLHFQFSKFNFSFTWTHFWVVEEELLSTDIFLSLSSSEILLLSPTHQCVIILHSVSCYLDFRFYLIHSISNDTVSVLFQFFSVMIPVKQSKLKLCH